MRAWSAKQRFPIAEWLQKLKKLHGDAIEIHMKLNGATAKQSKALTAPSHSDDSLVWPHKMSTDAKFLSWDEVVGSRRDFKLQNTNPFFTDPRGDYYRNLGKALENLTAKNSVSELCLEPYLVKSEKEWVNMYLDAKLGRSRPILSEKPSSIGSLPSRRKLHPTRKLTSAINFTLLFKRDHGLFDRKSKPLTTMAVEDVDTRHCSSLVCAQLRDNNNSQFEIPKCHNPPVGVAK